MRILLFNPDNGVTRNFMPHLWMFLLKALTPPEHEVLLIDGNAQRMDEDGIAQYVRDQKIDLVGIGAMTRMIQKAYRMADAIRAAGVPVVMGGPHVTEVPDEALGRDGGPQHADAVALAKRTKRGRGSSPMRREANSRTSICRLMKRARIRSRVWITIHRFRGSRWTSINSTWFPRSSLRC